MIVGICGMHRSGTSMLSHMLSLSGVYLGPPEVLAYSAPSNRDGFWEDSAFVQLNEEVLDALHGAWDVPPVFFDGWEASPRLEGIRTRAEQLIHERIDNGLWGWKDPRTSLTLPFWMRLIPGLRVVICLRNPLEVANSLNRRDYLSIAFGLRLWYVYQAAIVAAARPEDRLVTHYDAYFSDPHAELGRVLAFLGHDPDVATLDQAVGACNRELRNNHIDITKDPRVSQQVVRLYEALCRQAGPVCARALNLPLPENDAQLPLTSDDLCRLTPASDGVGQIVSLESSLLEHLRADNARRDETICRHGEELTVRDQRIGKLERSLRRTSARMRSLRKELDAARSSTARLESACLQAIQRQQETAAVLQGEMGRLRAEVQQIRRQDAGRLVARLGRIAGKCSGIGRHIASRIFAPLVRRRRILSGVDRLRRRGLLRAAEFARLRFLYPHRLHQQWLRRQFFDASWYLAQNADVAESGVDPLKHYLAHGVAEGRRPSPLFDTSWYLMQNPGVDPARIHPLLHFVLYGAVEGRKPNPLFDMESALRPQSQPEADVHPLARLLTPAVAHSSNPYFDAAWYLARYPDVVATGLDPLAHYLNAGWMEGRNPSPLFDNDWYLRQYPDVPGMPPLAHYLCYGMLEGRAPCPAILAAFAGPAPSGPVVFAQVERPVVSIVVSAQPRWLHTLWLLRSLQANGEGVPYEVLLIDDSHLHGDWGIRNHVQNARLVPADQAERADEVARGRCVLWLQADTLACSGYLPKILEVVGAAAAGGGATLHDIGEAQGIARLCGTELVERSAMAVLLWRNAGIEPSAASQRHAAA